MQLPGKPCAICDQPISGRSDGEFCYRCGVPVHRRCMPAERVEAADRCPVCGADRAAVKTWEGKRDAAAGRSLWADGASLSRHALGLIGLGGLLFCWSNLVGLVFIGIGVAVFLAGWRQRKLARRLIPAGHGQPDRPAE
jgi:hypothetical protein